MCAVSFVGDFYEKKWEPHRPFITETYTYPSGPSQAEFDALKKEVQDMKELLRRAKIYDDENNEPNCEIEDKMKFLRAVAKLVDIDLDDVIGKQKPN